MLKSTNAGNRLHLQNTESFLICKLAHKFCTKILDMYGIPFPDQILRYFFELRLLLGGRVFLDVQF